MGKVRDWWEGEYIPHENEPGSPIIFTGGTYKRHWTARLCHVVASYVGENHRWLITTAIAVAAVAAAWKIKG